MPLEPAESTVAPDASPGRDTSRRKALAKLGLAVGVAYMAPAIVHLDHAGEALAVSHCPPGYTLRNGQCQRSPSDARLKRDVVPVARLENGIGLYRYRYHWSDRLYVGVMAQEVAPIVPDAVTIGSGGFYAVDYARLGLEHVTWDAWQARTARVAA
jgi:hypothetical protein